MSSLPALRQPKQIKVQHKLLKNNDFVILTLRNESKLVITSDAYHGILTVENEFKCVFCKLTMELDYNNKESHKKTQKHLANMNNFPFMESFSDDLLKQLNRDNIYCTICNVTVMMPFLKRHIMSESHRTEFEKASTRSLNYKPNE